LILLFLLLAASVECVHVAPGKIENSSAAASCVSGDAPAYVKLAQPGVEFRPDVATATRAPWLISNGARILRAAGQPIFYQAAKGRADLCAAEAFAYGAQALIQAGDADRERLDPMLPFLKRADATSAAARANIAFVDDGSAEALEVMNLLTRRNLLFRIVKSPDPSLDLTVRIGSADFPKSAAANPSDFASLVRRKLTDEKRILRIYGSEVVVGRLTGDANRGRLHLLNYGNPKIEGLRVRVLGTYKNAQLNAPGSVAPLSDTVAANGAIEFSIPTLETYAIVELH
jgi:hypothetical protein